MKREEMACAVPLKERIQRAIDLVPVAITVDQKDDEGFLISSTNIPIQTLLEEALKALDAQEGWKPIESAPKDGREIEICGGTYVSDYDDYCILRPFKDVSYACYKNERDHGHSWRGEAEHSHDYYIWHAPKFWKEKSKPPLPTKGQR